MFKTKNEKIVAIVEARMTSSRLPGKVILPLAGRPSTQRLVERLRRSNYIDDIVVATTVNAQDDPLVDVCNKMNCRYFRGSENDVLIRVLGAAHENKADVIVEITGDCPLVDHRIVDSVIELYYSGSYDYASNVVPVSFPIGFDAQVFATSVLEKVNKLSDNPLDRVHVSSYIYTHPKIFNIVNMKAEGELFWPELGLTLDEQQDYALLNSIYESLVRIKEDFSAQDIIELLKKNPELIAINKDVRRKTHLEG